MIHENTMRKIRNFEEIRYFEYSKYTRLVKDDSIILNIIGKFNNVCEIFFLNID